MYGALRRSLVCWISCIVLVLIVFGFSYSQEPPKKKPDKSSQAEQNPPTYDRGTKDLPVIIQIDPSAPLKIETHRDIEAEQKKAWNEWITAYGTAAIAAFTFVLASATISLAVFTYRLWGATGNLVRGAEDTARRQLRAYISMIGAEDVQGEAGHFGFRVSFKNAGQTPAYDVVSGAMVSIAPFPRTDPLPVVPITDKSRSTFGPGIDSGLFPSRSPLNPGEIAGFEDRTLAIYIHGRIEYRDAFNEKRTTHFTMIKRKSPSGVYMIGNDRDGNDAN